MTRGSVPSTLVDGQVITLVVSSPTWPDARKSTSVRILVRPLRHPFKGHSPHHGLFLGSFAPNLVPALVQAYFDW